MHKKFEVNRTKIEGGCQLYTKAVPQQSWSIVVILIITISWSDLTIPYDIFGELKIALIKTT